MASTCDVCGVNAPVGFLDPTGSRRCAFCEIARLRLERQLLATQVIATAKETA